MVSLRVAREIDNYSTAWRQRANAWRRGSNRKVGVLDISDNSVYFGFIKITKI